MKKQLRLLMLTLLCAVFSTAWGADEIITFSEQGYSNQQAITEVSGVNFKITFDKGTNSNAPKYYTSGTAIRAYGGNTFTVSSASKTIEKIEITFGKDDGSNAITPSVGTYTNGTWTGESSNVVFTIGGTSGNRRLSAVAVTYADESGAKDPQLSFTDNTKTLTLGDAPYTNVITSAAPGDPLEDLTITYEAKNFEGTGTTDVIEVDAESGAVTTLKSGSAKVIASWLAVEGKWIAKSIDYTVYVNKKTAVIQPIENTSIQIGETMNFTVDTNSDGVISVESNNTDVATVTGSGTSYTITGVAKGKANITVSQAASETYKAANPIVFSVNVTAPLPENTLFYESFDKVNGSGGRDGIYTGSAGNNSLYKSGEEADQLGWVISDNTGKTYNNGGAYQCLKLGTSDPRIATTRSIALTGDGTLTFSAAGWFDGTNNFTISATGGTLSGDTQITLTNSTWNDYTVNITGATGNLVITFTGCRGFFDDILVVANPAPAPITATFNPTYKGLTSIYYSDKNLKVPANVTARTFAIINGAGQYQDSFTEGEVIPAGTGVVLEYADKTFEQNVTVTFTEGTAEEAKALTKTNQLQGYDEKTMITVDGDANDYYFFRLSIAKADSPNAGKVGFYWANSTGGPFEASAHKVFLVVPKDELQSSISSFSIEELTGIDSIKAEQTESQSVYSLSGIRMNTNNLPKGIYIVNGKKMIVK